MIKKLWIIFIAFAGLLLTSCNNKNETVWIAEPEDILMEEKAEDGAVLIEEAPDEIYVYVCGEVANPGVYKLASNQRVYEAIEAAGGLTDKADPNAINQAVKISDGEMIYVSSYMEENEKKTSNTNVNDGKVNINTASESELLTISGIGKSRAQAIIDYRDDNGSFREIKEIMKVPGIKAGLYEKIKDKIKI